MRSASRPRRQDPNEDALLRAVGRLLHVDDIQRINAYASIFSGGRDRLILLALSEEQRRLLRMAAASVSSVPISASLEEALAQIWEHPQVVAELRELLALLPEQVQHLSPPIRLEHVPLRLHARYTRTEILAAFGVGDRAKPPEWREGVRWDPTSRTDLFAFTLDKSEGKFSPTTRYRDYAISPT